MNNRKGELNNNLQLLHTNSRKKQETAVTNQSDVVVCLTLQTYRQAQRNLRFTVLNGLLLHAFPHELHKFAGLGQEKPGKYMALKNIEILVFSHWQGSQSLQFCLGKQAKMRKEHLIDRKYASPLLHVNKDRSSCCCLLLHTNSHPNCFSRY